MHEMEQTFDSDASSSSSEREKAESPAEECLSERCLGSEDYYMALAVLSSKRSRDPITKVGACLVSPDNYVMGLGYNTMPRGYPDTEENWEKSNKKHIVCHAELNAITLGQRCHGNAGLKDCRVYVTLAPCNECAKIIIQSGITKVVYLSDEKGDREIFIKAKEMLANAGVKYRQFSHTQQDIKISLNNRDLVKAPQQNDRNTSNGSVQKRKISQGQKCVQKRRKTEQGQKQVSKKGGKLNKDMS